MKKSLAIFVLLIAVGCGQHKATPPLADERPYVPQKLAVPHLPNAYQIHPKVFLVACPKAMRRFGNWPSWASRRLSASMVRSPMLLSPRNTGCGTSTCHTATTAYPLTARKNLPKAVRDLPGPIYIHCHHGKHRSPTAAAVACVAAGLIDPANAETILRTAGTSENYRGSVSIGPRS